MQIYILFVNFTTDITNILQHIISYTMKTLDILRIRKEKKVTQKALADMLNINQSFLSNIENGRSPLPHDKMIKIIETLGITNPDEYMKEVADTNNVKNVQRTILGSNTFTNMSTTQSSAEISDLIEGLRNQIIEQNKLIDYMKEKLDKSDNRIAKLEERNDELNQKNGLIFHELKQANEEIWKLRNLLVKHNIEY